MVQGIGSWVVGLALGFVIGTAACSSGGGGDASIGDLGPAGGPIDATPDMHCATEDDGGPRVTTVDPAACHPDAGIVTDATVDMVDYGATMLGQEGDDDDCKYHVKFTTTPVYQNTDVTFTVTATYKVNGMPLVSTNPYIEGFLNDTHPVPKSGTTMEVGGGVYKIAGVRFDAPGDWTVRFHFSDACMDSEESPHGHAAFFVRVP
jgi:hypothetical protein